MQQNGPTSEAAHLSLPWITLRQKWVRSAEKQYFTSENVLYLRSTFSYEIAPNGVVGLIYFFWVFREYDIHFVGDGFSLSAHGLRETFYGNPDRSTDRRKLRR
jgi:hypothetical protein